MPLRLDESEEYMHGLGPDEEWDVDGKVGYGLSEYLDQIVDGAPVGLAE
jgi:hypothetical protein